MSANNTILEVRDLKMHFPVRRGFLRRTVGVLRAVDGVSLAIRQGETLGLVGETGCGKTTTGRCIVRIYKPTAGEILYREKNGNVVDLSKLSNIEMRPYRREIRMIFQDPYSSLNPRMTIRDIIGEPMVVNRIAHGKEVDERVALLLDQVGLRPEYMYRYPHAFSGGERQRISIARALATNPRLVVADEPVSALDVSIRAQILNLLQDLQQEFNLTYLFIAHDLGVVEYICDRVAVMYVGKIVEIAETEELYHSPKHPYTEALLSAVPIPDPHRRGKRQRVILTGELPSPLTPPQGCYFHPRCPYAVDRCRVEPPQLREISARHFVACHRAEELRLRGV